MKGEDSHKAKLTEMDVRMMRAFYDSGAHTITELTSFYPVSRSHVYEIVNRDVWVHLD